MCSTTNHHVVACTSAIQSSAKYGNLPRFLQSSGSDTQTRFTPLDTSQDSFISSSDRKLLQA